MLQTRYYQKDRCIDGVLRWMVDLTVHVAAVAIAIAIEIKAQTIAMKAQTIAMKAQTIEMKAQTASAPQEFQKTIETACWTRKGIAREKKECAEIAGPTSFLEWNPRAFGAT